MLLLCLQYCEQNTGRWQARFAAQPKVCSKLIHGLESTIVTELEDILAFLQLVVSRRIVALAVVELILAPAYFCFTIFGLFKLESI